jgi:hypothetical protein
MDVVWHYDVIIQFDVAEMFRQFPPTAHPQFRQTNNLCYERKWLRNTTLEMNNHIPSIGWNDGGVFRDRMELVSSNISLGL